MEYPDPEAGRMKEIRDFAAIFTTQVRPEVRGRVLRAIADNTRHIGRGEWINNAGVPCLFTLAYTEAIGRQIRPEDIEVSDVAEALGLENKVVVQGYQTWDDMGTKDSEDFRKEIREHLKEQCTGDRLRSDRGDGEPEEIPCPLPEPQEEPEDEEELELIPA